MPPEQFAHGYETSQFVSYIIINLRIIIIITNRLMKFKINYYVTLGTLIKRTFKMRFIQANSSRTAFSQIRDILVIEVITLKTSPLLTR
jgi:hypothetical protein